MQLSITIAKAHRTITVDTLKLCNGNAADMAALDSMIEKYPNTVRYLFNYGATQSLNDAHAPIKSTDADIIMAAVQKRLTAIETGQVKVRGSGTRGVEPLVAQCNKIATAWWKKIAEAAQMAAIGKVRATLTQEQSDGATDEAIAAMIVAAKARHPATIEQAKAIIAANAIKVDATIDLDDLGLGESESDEDESDEESDE